MSTDDQTQGPRSGLDSGPDTDSPSGLGAGPETGSDSHSGPDAGPDAGLRAGPDTGSDSGTDSAHLSQAPTVASDTTTALPADPPTAALPAGQDETLALASGSRGSAYGDESRPAAASYPLAVAPAGAVPADPDPDAGRWASRGLRMRTVVLGLVLLAVSGTSLVRVLTGAHVDDTVVLLTLLIVAGALLLGGGVASAAREARGARRRY